MSADNWAECPRCVANLDADARTFREDYEIYGAETGTVTVSYRGECQRCNLLLEFETTHPIPGWQPPNKPTGPVESRPWSAVPAGWFVQTPRGVWLEVTATRLDAGRQVVEFGKSQGTHQNPLAVVPCRRGTWDSEVSDAVDLFGEGAEILEDRT